MPWVWWSANQEWGLWPLHAMPHFSAHELHNMIPVLSYFHNIVRNKTLLKKWMNVRRLLILHKFFFSCIMLAELLLLVRQPKVLFSSFEFFEKCEVTSFCKKFRSRWLQWFCIWNWMFLLSLLYLAIVRMINKDFVVVSCSAVMRSNNVMSWKVRGNKKRKI